MKLRKHGKMLLVLSLIVCAVLCLTACGMLKGSPSDSGSNEKVTLTRNMITWEDVTYTYGYSGQPIVLNETNFRCNSGDKYAGYSDFTFTYSNNVNVGTATVTVSANKSSRYFKGSVELNFTIGGNSVYVRTLEDLTETLKNNNISEIIIDGKIIVPSEETIEISQTRVLKIDRNYDFVVNGKLENNGKIIIDGGMSTVVGRFDTFMVNNGTIINNGTIEIRKDGALYNAGTCVNNDKIINSGKIYSNDSEISDVTDNDDAVNVVRTKITEDNVIAENLVCEFKKGVYSYFPNINIIGSEYSIIYENNTQVGEATAKITIDEFDTKYYGNIDIGYSIIKGTVTVTSYSDFIECKNSGNFRAFEAFSLEIPEDAMIVLEENETIVTNRLTVYGKLTNNGTINTGILTINTKAELNNVGTLTTSDVVNIYGELTNEVNGIYESANKTNMLSGGKITNFGEMNFNGEFASSLNSYLINKTDAIMNFDMLAGIGGDTENFGEMNFSSANFYNFNTLINNEGGVIVFNGNTVFYTADTTNNGIIINNGNLVINAINKFENGKNLFDNSNGKIWTYDAIENVTENVVIKKLLSDESVVVALEYNSVDYDGTEKKPAFTIDDKQLDEEEYTVKYEYEEKTKTNIVDAGRVKVIITIKSDFSLYGGKIEVFYDILRVEKIVSDENELKNAVLSENYSKIILNFDLIDFATSISVKKDVVFDTNGHNIVLRGRISNYGTFINSVTDDENENNGRIDIVANGALWNYGNLVNNGLIYAQPSSAILSNTSLEGYSPVMENNGVIYNHSTMSCSGSGKTYIRSNLLDLNKSGRFELEYYKCKYNTFEHRPAVALKNYKGDYLSLDDFKIEYKFNTEVGTAWAVVTTINQYSEHYYGSVILNFEIEKGIYHITTQTFPSGNSDFVDVFADEGFSEYILSENNVYPNRNITIRKNCVFDFGTYDFNFQYNNSEITFADGSIIKVSIGDKERFDYYKYIVDEMTFVDNITSDNYLEFKILNNENRNLLRGSTQQKIKLDLNGFVIDKGLDIYNTKTEWFEFTIIDGSNGKSGAIGNINSGVVGLVVSGTPKKTKLILNSITAYGLYLKGGNGRCEVEATDCRFLTNTSDFSNISAFESDSWLNVYTTFDNCEIRGYNAAYISGGTHTFNNCTIYSTGIYESRKNNSLTTKDYYRRKGNAITFDNERRVNGGLKHGMTVNINGGSVFSEQGYAVEILCAEAIGGIHYSLSGDVTIYGEKGNYISDAN